jgi:hypothetical protein
LFFIYNVAGHSVSYEILDCWQLCNHGLFVKTAQVTIVVVAVPEGLPLAVTLT